MIQFGRPINYRDLFYMQDLTYFLAKILAEGCVMQSYSQTLLENSCSGSAPIQRLCAFRIAYCRREPPVLSADIWFL